MAHICEHHLCGINESCGGIGGMDESFVEHYHQVAHRAHQRFINVSDKERKAVCAVKHETIATDKDVSAHFVKVN
jgi:hypothetical protein